MEKEIQEIIKKHMPEQLGEVLKARLIELEGFEYECEELKGSNKTYQENHKRLNKEVADLTATLESHNKLDEREEHISKRENKKDVHEAQARANHAEEKVNMMQGLLNTVFRSPVYTKSNYKNFTNEQCQDANGNWGSYGPATSENSTETISED